MELDHLPSSVIEDILARLPLPEAVKTSQLSRAWRHRWQSMPRLIFDGTGFPQLPGEDTQEYDRRLVKAVDRALLLHAGPIHEFKLSTDLQNCADVDAWVWVLSRKGVRGVVLDFWPDYPYRLPSSLFECELLRRLVLYRCVSRLPAAFKGFRDLVTLELQDFTLTGDDLERLISSCPCLENLQLVNNRGCDKIAICAPSLRKLTIVGSFKSLALKNTPVLATASFDWLATPFCLKKRSVCKLVELFSALPRIENLVIKGLFLRLLSEENMLERLPATQNLLKNVSMDVNLENLHQCMIVFCLLRSCPSLEMLKIHHTPFLYQVSPDVNEFCWGISEGLDCYKFGKLLCVEIATVVGSDPEMAFIRFMLVNAPKLVHLNVRLDKKASEDVSWFKMVTKNLLSCPRASTQARIILLE